MRTLSQSGTTPKAYRKGERISTAHVECTVNQLINWRMCKKQQMGWSRSPVLASRENRDYQRATGQVYRASFNTGRYRRLTPRFLSVSFMSLRTVTRGSFLCTDPKILTFTEPRRCPLRSAS